LNFFVLPMPLGGGGGGKNQKKKIPQGRSPPHTKKEKRKQTGRGGKKGEGGGRGGRGRERAGEGGVMSAQFREMSQLAKSRRSGEIIVYPKNILVCPGPSLLFGLSITRLYSVFIPPSTNSGLITTFAFTVKGNTETKTSFLRYT